jgi:hypothetical protein
VTPDFRLDAGKTVSRVMQRADETQQLAIRGTEINSLITTINETQNSRPKRTFLAVPDALR